MNKNGSSTNSMKQIKFPFQKSVQVTKVFVKKDHRITQNETIFTMVDTIDGKKEQFVSNVSGTITKLYIHEWDVLSHDSVVLEYEECEHKITFKNLCCDCGIDLNQLKDRLDLVSTRNTTTDSVNDTNTASIPPIRAATTVSMEHTVPELRITPEMAEKYSIEERDRLLRERKLDLLVDLDQTLLHTTNSSHYYPYSPEIIAYQLSTQSPQTFYTKLRPGVKDFLTNLLPYYQFHIVTFGERLYAHKMASLIDPDKKFFYHRILSRNECFDPTRKTANLSALFPCGDSMVCIIDDREDVWNYARNLVHVKPYVWFKDVGDINDIHLPSPPFPSEQLIPPISEKEFQEQLENSEHLAEEKSELESQALIERTTEEGYQNAIHRGEKRKLDNENESTNSSANIDEGSKKLKEQNDTESNIIPDTDIYLHRLEVILRRIHKDFYQLYDQWLGDKTRPMPDLKQILPDYRRQTLKNVSVCFSHLMPQGYPLEKHRATIIARAMGAIVTQDLQINDQGQCLTTHVVAGKRTTKVDRAIKYQIFVVTPEWLIDCYEQWERKNEGDYVLTPSYDVRKSRLFTRETPRIAYNELNAVNEKLSATKLKTTNSSDEEQVSSSTTEKPSKSALKRPRTPDLPSSSEVINEEEQTTSRQYNFSMSVDELSDMEKEVNDFCGDDDDDEDDDNDEPRPAKQQKKSKDQPTIEETTNDDNGGGGGSRGGDDDYNSDSSSSQKLRDLILGKRHESDTDEENLDDDDAPRGWKSRQ